MATQADLETSFLAYARSVIRATSHEAACRRACGHIPPDTVEAPYLRWPGYLGREYQRGGLLCVSHVHTRFASGGLAAMNALIQRAVAATVGWREGTSDDAEWLDATRAMYVCGLGDRGWTVGKHYRTAWAELGEDEHSIAYVNAARCQYLGSPPARLIRTCLADLPLRPLIDILRPRLVLTTVRQISVESRLLGVPSVYFHQRNGWNLRDVELRSAQGVPFTLVPAPASEWAAALAACGFRRQDAATRPT